LAGYEDTNDAERLSVPCQKNRRSKPGKTLPERWSERKSQKITPTHQEHEANWEIPGYVSAECLFGLPSAEVGPDIKDVGARVMWQTEVIV
jgi:hypothetical protein